MAALARHHIGQAPLLLPLTASRFSVGLSLVAWSGGIPLDRSDVCIHWVDDLIVVVLR